MAEFVRLRRVVGKRGDSLELQSWAVRGAFGPSPAST